MPANLILAPQSSSQLEESIGVQGVLTQAEIDALSNTVKAGNRYFVTDSGAQRVLIFNADGSVSSVSKDSTQSFFFLDDSVSPAILYYWSPSSGTHQEVDDQDYHPSKVYSQGDVVRDPITGRLYESLVNTNQGNALTATASWKAFAGDAINRIDGPEANNAFANLTAATAAMAASSAGDIAYIPDTQNTGLYQQVVKQPDGSVAIADDIVGWYANRAAFPATGSTRKLYGALDTDFVYRWDVPSNDYIELLDEERQQLTDLATLLNIDFTKKRIQYIDFLSQGYFSSWTQAILNWIKDKDGNFYPSGSWQTEGGTPLAINMTPGINAQRTNRVIYTGTEAANGISEFNFSFRSSAASTGLTRVTITYTDGSTQVFNGGGAVGGGRTYVINPAWDFTSLGLPFVGNPFGSLTTPATNTVLSTRDLADALALKQNINTDGEFPTVNQVGDRATFDALLAGNANALDGQIIVVNDGGTLTLESYAAGARVMQEAYSSPNVLYLKADGSGLYRYDGTTETQLDGTESRTLHNLGAIGPTALTRFGGPYQGEIHVEAAQNWSLDANLFQDGDFFRSINTSGAITTSNLVPSNFAGVFLRDGFTTDVSGGLDLGSAIDKAYLITITENGGNKFLNFVDETPTLASGNAALLTIDQSWSFNSATDPDRTAINAQARANSSVKYSLAPRTVVIAAPNNYEITVTASQSGIGIQTVYIGGILELKDSTDAVVATFDYPDTEQPDTAGKVHNVGTITRQVALNAGDYTWHFTTNGLDNPNHAGGKRAPTTGSFAITATALDVDVDAASDWSTATEYVGNNRVIFTYTMPATIASGTFETANGVRPQANERRIGIYLADRAAADSVAAFADDAATIAELALIYDYGAAPSTSVTPGELPQVSQSVTRADADTLLAALANVFDGQTLIVYGDGNVSLEAYAGGARTSQYIYPSGQAIYQIGAKTFTNDGSRERDITGVPVWSNSENRYGTALGRIDKVVGSDGKIYLAQQAGIAQLQDPTTQTDETNWKAADGGTGGKTYVAASSTIGPAMAEIIEGTQVVRDWLLESSQNKLIAKSNGTESYDQAQATLGQTVFYGQDLGETTIQNVTSTTVIPAGWWSINVETGAQAGFYARQISGTYVSNSLGADLLDIQTLDAGNSSTTPSNTSYLIAEWGIRLAQSNFTASAQKNEFLITEDGTIEVAIPKADLVTTPITIQLAETATPANGFAVNIAADGTLSQPTGDPTNELTGVTAVRFDNDDFWVVQLSGTRPTASTLKVWGNDIGDPTDFTDVRYAFRIVSVNNVATYNVTTNGGADILGTAEPGQWVQVVVTVPNGQYLSGLTVPTGVQYRILEKYEGVALVLGTTDTDITPVFAAASLTTIDYDIGSIAAWFRTNNPSSAYGRMWGTDAERTYSAATNPEYATFLGMVQSGDIPAGVAVDNGDNTFTLQDWSGVYIGGVRDTKTVGEFENYLTARPRISNLTGFTSSNGGGTGNVGISYYAAAGSGSSTGTNAGNHTHSVTINGGGDSLTQPPTRFGRWVIKLVGTPTQLATGATLNVTQDITQVPYDVTVNGTAIATKAVKESSRLITVPLSANNVEIDGAVTATNVSGTAEIIDRGFNGNALISLQADGNGAIAITFSERTQLVPIQFNSVASAGTTIERGRASIVQIPLTSSARQIDSASLDATGAVGATAADRVKVISSGVGGFAYVRLTPQDGIATVDITFNEQAIAIPLDTYQGYSGFFNNLPGNAGYAWTERTRFGTAITTSLDGIVHTLAEGFTYRVRYVPVRGRANGQFVNVAYLEDGVRLETFYAISDDDANWAGGAGYERIVEAPTGGGAKTVQFWRFANSGNGNHDALLFIEAIAKDSATTLPELFPRHEVRNNGASFTPQEFITQGAANTVRVPITAANMGIELDATALAAGMQLIWHGNGPTSDAIVSIPSSASAGTVDITYTLNDVVEGSRSLNQIGEYRPTNAVDIANSTINMGLDLRTADYLTVSLRDTGAGGWPWPVATLDLKAIREQTNDQFFVWNHDVAHVNFTITDRENGVLQVTDHTRNAVFEAAYTEAWGFNHYLTPTGYDPLAQQTITVNGAAPLSGSPGFIDRMLPVEFALAAGQQVDQATVAATNGAEIGDIIAGDGTGPGIIFIRPTVAGPIDVTFTTKDAGTGSRVETRVGFYEPTPGTHFRLGAASGGEIDINVGFDCTLCDEIRIAVCRNSDGIFRQVQSAPVELKYGNSNDMWWAWADGNRRAGGYFKSEANAKAGIITFNDEIEATGAYWIAGYRTGAVGYQVSQAQTAVNSRAITVNGGPPLSGGSLLTDIGGGIVRYMPANGMQVSQASVANTGTGSVELRHPGLGGLVAAEFWVDPTTDMDITFTEVAYAQGAVSLQPIHSVTGQNIDLDTNPVVDLGVVLQEGDTIVIEQRYTTAAERATIRFVVTEGGSDRQVIYPTTTELIRANFSTPLTSSVTFTDFGGNTNNTLTGWKVYRDLPGAFVVPEGTTAATAVQATVVFDGSAATILTPVAAGNVVTLHELKDGQIRVQLPSDKILLNAVPDNAGVVLTPRDIEQGVFDYSIPAGTGDFTITVTSGDRNSHKVLIASGNDLTQGNTFSNFGNATMGSLFGSIAGNVYTPGQYQGLWVNYFEGEAENRCESQYLDAEEWVRHGYAQIYIGGHAGEYIILTTRTETDTQWQTAQGSTPNSDVRIWGVRGNVAIPQNYSTPSLRTLTLDAAGSVTQFLNGSNSVQLLEGMGAEVAVQLTAGNRLRLDQPTPAMTSGFAAVSEYSGGVVQVRMGIADSTLTLNEEPIERDYVRLQPADPNNGAIATGGDSVVIDLVLPSDGYWRGTVAPAAWDNDIGGNLGLTIEILGTDGTTVLDTAFSCVNGNHNSGAWEYLPPAFIDLGVVTAGSYKIRVRDINGSGEGDGVAICAAFFERR